MITASHARAVERLIPLIEDHGLAISGQTAAAVYGLTARDTSELLELASVEPATESAVARLQGDLERNLLDEDGERPPASGRRPGPRARVDVWGVDNVLCAVAMRDDDERPHLSIEVDLGGLSGGPADARPTALTPGGVRVVTVEQVVAARQVVARWATAPEDLASAFDVGIATHRVGADLALSVLSEARRDELAVSVERARSLLDDGLVSADFVTQARGGLAEAHKHLLAQRRIHGQRL